MNYLTYLRNVSAKLGKSISDCMYLDVMNGIQRVNVTNKRLLRSSVGTLMCAEYLQ